MTGKTKIPEVKDVIEQIRELSADEKLKQWQKRRRKRGEVNGERSEIKGINTLGYVR